MTYVISDIHGNRRCFDSVMKQICLSEDDTLYILGDVIDRHPDGIGILSEIMKMPNVKMLLGNHEYLMLRALGHPYDDDDIMSESDTDAAVNLWYLNAGEDTHRAFMSLSREEQREIIDYLTSLPLNIDVEAGGKLYKLVHAAAAEGYVPGMKCKSITKYATWERIDPWTIPPRGYTIVFGHTPTKRYLSSNPMKIWRGNDFIGIDCGSGYPERGYSGVLGRLACLRLDDDAEFYSE